ncbi:restriction endonuclease [Helicobacter suis]|uniref:restriction endonuclease n=1 Tax=Helicobacter suis TaxID=104628 RepID=UPI0013D40E70|nr:restriction endonuclease [Helicobacter suis]
MISDFFFFPPPPPPQLDCRLKSFRGHHEQPEYAPSKSKFVPLNLGKDMQKGREYENFVAKYYAERGYSVAFHRDLGKKDQKVDLILTKDNVVLFVQCKNWNENNPYRISLDYVKAFLQNCDVLQREELYRGKDCQRLLVLSSKVLDKEAYQFIKECTYDQRVRYQILPKGD